MKILDVEGICMNFGGIVALSDVNFSISPGERVALIGPNGAGKTTLFNVLQGQLKATRGSIKLFSKDITRMSVHRRAHAGIARSFQVVNLLMTSTVLENVVLAVQGAKPSRFHMILPINKYNEIYEKAKDLLKSINLWGLRNKPVNSISYGDQRKLEITLSLASNPKILLLDEPNCGLTQDESDGIIRMIRDLNSEISVIMVAHDLDFVMEAAQRILVLHFGKIIAEGSPENICDDSRVNEIYMGAEEGSVAC